MAESCRNTGIEPDSEYLWCSTVITEFINFEHGKSKVLRKENL